jgi:lipid II:glycine glycyltransferase (peptidoglycan interpeptide bridge formation enzyme)
MTSAARLEVREAISADTWDRFVSTSDHALLFHRRDWLEVLRDTQGASLRLFGVHDPQAGDDPVALMPVLVRRFGPFRVAASPLVVEDTPYLGPVASPSLIPDVLIATRDRLRRDVHFIRLLLPDTLPEPARRTLEAAGYSLSTKTTHLLDLTPGKEALWKQMQGRARTAVRRATKSGIELLRTGSPDEALVDRYYALVAAVYADQGRDTPNPRELYQQLFRRLGADGALSLTLATVDGADVAGAVFGYDEHRAYYLNGASLREFRKLNATNLVLWSEVEAAADSGRPVFDFVGSDIPRLAKFKASFGGQLTEHLCVEWARSRAVASARTWYATRGKILLEKWRKALP